MTNEEAVAAGIAAYAEAEAALRTAHDAMLKLPAVYSAVAQNGIDPRPPGVQAFGYFESQKRGNKARQGASHIAHVLDAIIDLHSADTDRAQELGIDLPPPAPPGTVTPMGGGR